jgi:hypothetical protein
MTACNFALLVLSTLTLRSANLHETCCFNLHHPAPGITSLSFSKNGSWQALVLGPGVILRITLQREWKLAPLAVFVRHQPDVPQFSHERRDLSLPWS